MKTKQVIVIRKDLKMRKGKMIAQGAHASLKVFLDDCIKSMDGRTYIMMAHPLNPWYHWLNGLFTKVVVGCDSEDELLDLHREAAGAGILVSLIQDSGRTEFHGEPTYTALAIGPDEIEKIDKITGHLKLL